MPYRTDPGYPLKKWDVITRIGDTPVDNQGMIKLGDNLRVSFAYMIQKIAADGRVPLTVVRNGKEMRLDLPVSSKYPMVVPDLAGAYPAYFVYGPIVFTAATKQFMDGLVADGHASGFFRWLILQGSPLLSRASEQGRF